MKKTISRVLALAMAAMFTLSGCGGGSNNPPATSSETPATSSAAPATSSEAPATSSEAPAVVIEGEPITDLVYSRLATRELQTFNILFSQSASDFENLCNTNEGLLEVDTYGRLQPALASEWGTEDGGKTWTFKLREGLVWVDVNGNEKAANNAHDFATGLEWVLNFHKNEAKNTTMPIEMIEGAGDYYEYTKNLSEEEGFALTAGEGSKFAEMVGIEIPDDYTVIYHCLTEKAYFDSVATYACLYPMNQGMVDELTVPGVKAMDNETMWYNGCYLMTSYVHQNEKIFEPNPSYWDKDCTLFNSITIKMPDSNDVAFQLYTSGEIDYVPLTESNLQTIYNNPSHEFHDYLVPDLMSKYSYQFHFNYDKNNADGTSDTNWNTAIANKAFRQSWWYGLDLVNYFKRTNAITPMVCENNFYTMKGLVYTSDGRDYVELVREELGLPELNGEKMVRLDDSKFAELKTQAMEELTALGVTFPVECDYYISASSQTALDSANVLKQTFTDNFGDDYIVLNIKTYVSNATQEVWNPQLHSIAINGWGADYGDPQNYVGQETYGIDGAYYSKRYSNINKVAETEATADLIEIYKEYTRLVAEGDAITDDMDARYAAFAKAEAYMIDNALIVPAYYSKAWCLTRVNLYSKMYAMFGSQNEKMKNWETNANGYTSADMEAIVAAR